MLTHSAKRSDSGAAFHGAAVRRGRVSFSSALHSFGDVLVLITDLGVSLLSSPQVSSSSLSTAISSTTRAFVLLPLAFLLEMHRQMSRRDENVATERRFDAGARFVAAL